MKKYYVYQHIREDKNEIFYIGIGTKSKQDLKCNTYSRAYSKHIDNNIWLKVVAKTKWKFEILFESDDRKEVEQMEIDLIAKYGRKCCEQGILANLTLGGESNKGYKFTEEQRQKISNAQKGKVGRRLGAKLTKEQKEKFSEIQKEVANRPEMIEYRRKLALGNSYHLGKKHSEESKLKMSESAKNRGCNAKTISCKLVMLDTNTIFEAKSLEELARISPISINTIRRIYKGTYKGNWVGTKINIEFYE
mgnify:FL=1